MKRILLSMLMMGVGLLSAQIATISFEQSENFVPGDINGQNSQWTSTAIQSGGNIPGQVISNAQASDGTQSLNITHLPEYGQQQQPIIGAVYTPATPIPWQTGMSISYDFYGTALDGSDFYFMMVDLTQQSYITYSVFNYEGNVTMAGNSATGEGQIHPSTGTWAPNQWHNLRMEFQDDGLLHLFLNDVEISTGAPFQPSGGANIEHIWIYTDNYGGDAFYDNIIINDNLSTSDMAMTRAASAVYPNPAKDQVNVRLAADFQANKTTATITNMAGQKVASFSSVDQINVGNLPAGVYVLTLTDGTKTETKKLIKK